MNKAELIDAVAKEAKMSKKDATTAVDSVVNIVTNSLKKGEKVTLVGFGTWEVRKRKPRKGVNPRTGEAIKIQASKVVAFKPGAAMKEAVSPKKK
ncbi:MAG: DNA-binding protein [Actinobacteria bacterium RBG_19FT_COMBO_54_7]|uniref:DNA-binding protein n=1 Tax=Candidatus Solincola sediminis TaxID=1797199 RepID=A0A1F2WNT9_9ACTN|nr:MAG: DNA-binding protein [Candidatus Solincola sediminis]OFW58511.1 MAG: DNA-binding protein [Candidatus Solincola sediminis]OFW65373.1 MAG: DNA-binding protein [Actinobacteria bacterium RBG_19FT_COMBO_54_7]